MDIPGIGTLLLLVISSIFIFSTWKRMCKKSNLPPGPTPLPLVGNFLQMRSGEMAESLFNLWKVYGSVYTLHFGPKPVVFLCGYETVKEALVDQAEEFSSRGSLPIVDNFVRGYGLGFANGERWKQMRAFTLKTLKNFGMGKKSMEEKIQEEATFLVEELQKSKELPMDPSKLLMKAACNILYSITFGNRLDYKDEALSKILNKLDESFQIFSSIWGQLKNILPSVMNYVPGPHQKIDALSAELVELFHERVKINQSTLDPSCPRDFVDCFLIKMQEEKQNPNTEFTMRNLLMTDHTLFFGGIETVSTTIRHGLLFLLKYPEIQAKLHKEIDQVIGQNQMPNMGHRNEMPYMNAVIHEILRFADVTPLGVPHCVTKDTKFRGYTIPKGTDIYPLLFSVHRDPSKFSTPYKFNPNHFLDEDGRFKNNKAMLTFSAGKRVCLGEPLARMELFLFFTTILQNFTLTSKTQFTESDITPRMTGVFKFPIYYELSFVTR
ncbi:cytochrome P450 2G1-like [Discoglossus pictus]